MTAIQPLVRTRLADDLAQRIAHLIQEGGHRAGHRLPSITVMAKQFGVGHPTVREALRKLETVGVIQIRHGSGVYVKDPGMLMALNPVHDEPVSKQLLVDLLEARIAIELTSVALAARNASETDLDEMTRLLDEARSNLDNDRVLSEVNMRYHLQIATASGNRVLYQILKVLSGLFQHEQRWILNIYGSRKHDHEEHRGILAALRLRDEALASGRMRAHLQGVRDVLLQWDPQAAPVS